VTPHMVGMAGLRPIAANTSMRRFPALVQALEAAGPAAHAAAASQVAASSSGRTFEEACRSAKGRWHSQSFYSQAGLSARADFSEAHGPDESTEPGGRPAAGLGKGRDGLAYATHIPLSALQKAAIAVGSALGALAHPDRADLVSQLPAAAAVTPKFEFLV
jgi:hypothetical protein